MSPEQMRIAIAEACGWEQFKIAHEIKSGDKWPVFRKDGRVASAYTNTLPDYLNDLNAIAEAVKTIAVVDGSHWVMELRRIVVRDCEKDPLCTIDTGRVNDCWFYNATAAQRAEAFLKTKGLWKP